MWRWDASTSGCRDPGRRCSRGSYGRARLRLLSLDVPLRPDEELAASQVLRLRAYAVGTLAHIAAEPLTGAYCASRHLLLALKERAGDHMLRGISDELTLVAAAGPRASRQVERLVAKIHALLPAAPSREDRLYAEMMLGVVPLLAGRFDEASVMLGRSEAAIRSSAAHMTWELSLGRMLLLTAEMFHRGLGDSGPSLDAWIADARRRRDDAALRYFWIKQVMTRIACDDLEGARESAREAECSMVASSGSLDMDRATLLNVQVYAHLYGARTASDTTRAMADALLRVMRSSVGRVWGLYTTAATLRAGLLLMMRPTSRRKARLDRHIDRIERELLAERTDYTRGYARVIAAALEHQRGRSASAVTLLEEAAIAFERAGMRPACASARVRLGQLRGDREGRRLLDSAFAELTSLGVRRPDRYVRLYTPGFHLGAREDGSCAS
jgi:hypothetical protein